MGWLAWALACTAAWGLGTLTSKPSTDRLGARTMLLAVAATEGAAFAGLGLALERVPISGGLATLGLAYAAGVAGIVGYVFFYEGIRLGSVGVVGTVTAAYPVVTVVLSLAFLGEKLFASQGIGVALIVLSVALLAYEPGGLQGSKRAAILLSILGFVSWGLWGFLAKLSVDELGEANLFLFYGLANVSVGTAYFVVRRLPTPSRGIPRGIVGLAVVTVACGAFGVFALTLAYTEGPASLVSPVSGSYPVVATLAAVAFLRERMTLRVAVALVCFALGLGLLSAV